MNGKKYKGKALALLAVMLVWLCSMTVLAEGASGDNSLSTLGITTEGAVVSPDFYYSTIEYNVTVPEGTTQLELNPVTSNENAWIVDITGTELVNGETTVVITVSAENGNQYSYYLYVKADASAGTVAPATEAQTEPETEEETEPQTEDPRYVRVDRNSLKEAENTISALKSEATGYRDRLNLLMNILYGMIGFCVVLLFVVINLILKKKDMKNELKKYRGMGYVQEQNSAGYDAYQEEQPAKKSKKERKKGKKNKKNQDMYEDQYDSQGYVQDGYDQQGYEDNYSQGGYDQQGYEDNYSQGGYDQQGYEDDYSQGGYDQQSYEEPVYDRKARKMEQVKDDPTTVPKPAKARKQSRKMPEYQKPQQNYTYQPQQESASENVEITMIDL